MVSCVIQSKSARSEFEDLWSVADVMHCENWTPDQLPHAVRSEVFGTNFVSDWFLESVHGTSLEFKTSSHYVYDHAVQRWPYLLYIANRLLRA